MMVILGEDLDEDQSEAWLGAIEDGVFDEEKGLEEKCRAATAFAAKRRESRRWFTFLRSNPHDAPPLWCMETSRGPVHFEQGQGQQARPWDCSFVLTKYLDQHPEEIRGKGVLELGCGVGIPGVAAAVLGAEEVILTDMAAGLQSIERTIALNPSVACKLTGRVLHWGSRSETTELLLAARRPITVVLCSDLLYGEGESARMGAGGTGSAAEMLATTLDAVCSKNQTTVVLNCHERRFFGDKGAFFFETMRRRGFEVLEGVDLREIDERFGDDDGISLTRLRKLPSSGDSDGDETLCGASDEKHLCVSDIN